MPRAASLASLCAALGALAAPALAEPLETPLKNQTGVLSYEVRMTGKHRGRQINDRIAIRTTVAARESGAINPYADGFTASQQAYFDEMSAATTSAGDGTAAMMEMNRLINVVEQACAGAETSSACAAAQARFQTANQALEDQGAKVAAAQAQVRVRDEDNHRFLVFMSGRNAVLEASYDHGGRKGGVSYPDPAVPDSDIVTLGDMFVLDRRDGAIGLTVLAGGGVEGEWVGGDPKSLMDVSGVRQVGHFAPTVTLQMQPTAGPDGAYAGRKTLEAAGVRYEISWKLELD